MKKLAILLVLGLLLQLVPAVSFVNAASGGPIITNNTPVNIPDTNLKEALITLGTDTNSDGIITVGEMGAGEPILWRPLR